ncbi:MAG: protein kinase [Chloroflexi bacterium]|uniref:protein kinase domain-containing protein n=1 Tax=Candidatus Flexifilum breve TaxID=3140694 RepID=UPI003136AA78|nr:protein kinase [Chloroflexota bacterium]
MDEWIGKRVGGYEIRSVIGRGGMAAVYLAHQISMSSRLVALKVLPRQFLHDDTYMQRFSREVQIVSTLEHRSIVPVYDHGEHDGQPYIVMRYLAGGSVDSQLRQGALDPKSILGIIQQIAPALDYAHSKGVLHRDLKPSNILLDDAGGAFLTDFGIARVVGEVPSGSITTQGAVGTPSYMSPEQAQGKPLDGRSDIYALGITVFEMITGVRPFEADTPYGTAVLQVTAPPPSPREFRPELSLAVEGVILKALSKRRELRHGSATEFADAFKQALDAPPITLLDTQPSPANSPPSAGQRAAADQQYAAALLLRLSPGHDAAPSRPVVPRRSGSRWWLSLSVGALFGCILLSLIVVAAMLVINSLAEPTPATTPSIAESAPTTTAQVLPTLTPLPRAEATTEVAPVGEIPTPALDNTVENMLSGTLVYFAYRDDNFDVYRMSLPDRFEIRLTNSESRELFPVVSPDGERIAYMSDRDGDFDIYVMNMNGMNVRRVTDNEVADRFPAWSPDGNWLVFSSDVRGDGTDDLYRVRVDGSGLMELYSDGQRNLQPSYQPDGAMLVFVNGDPFDAQTWEIMSLELDTRTVNALTDNDVRDSAPVWTPDGQILYISEGEGYAAIRQMEADGGGDELIYDGSGYESTVSAHPDGGLLIFTSAETGRDELYVYASGGRYIQQLTSNGAAAARWVRGAS